eukprot:TRINITY_DN14315_c0_g2_i3.p1 TRINITY_DN14315_c0_g2~~TRINITY_DN14315_c0_g2_i3.p1  ORF type:complete len:341 (+),score=58.16 TRINITY_DN14315_c0_g2_i3:141-1163(+)
MLRSLVGSEMCIRDSQRRVRGNCAKSMSCCEPVTPSGSPECAPTPISRTPSGLVLTPGPSESSPRAFCRSHSGSFLGPAHLASLKRKPSASPQSMRNVLRKKAHVNLSIDIPTLWLPPMEDEVSPPRPVSEELCMSEERDVARAWVRNLFRESTKLLALDFDLTCISINTRGRWTGTSTELAAHFRPLIQEVVHEACAIGMHVAIASFSVQQDLITEVVRIVFPDHWESILIRAGPPEQFPALTVSDQLAAHNKQRHILSVATELGIEPQQVMLVDDDFSNVADAQTNGSEAVWFNPEEPLSFLCDLCQSREITMFACTIHDDCEHLRSSVSPHTPLLMA